MKLFIPTCTLNFNNIFSTESISPKAFYTNRGFGNRRYYPVEANSLDNAVTLYSKYPVFHVGNTDLENYPMVIEIDTDDYEQTEFNPFSSNNGIEIYTCASTIYLNPFHCFVYFDSCESRQGVLTKAEQSLENKFSKLYSSNFRIWRHEAKGLLGKTRDLFTGTEQTEFLWDATYTPTNTTTYSNTRDDAYIDRLKGFLYCYLIGANSSVSKEISELKAIARVLRNTLSAVINSPEHRPTEIQNKILVENIKRFNSIFKDETAKQDQEKMASFLKQYHFEISVEAATHFLKRCDGVFCKLYQSPVYDANDLWTSVEYPIQEAYPMALDKMNRAVSQVGASELSKREKEHLASLIQVDANNRIHIMDPSCTHAFYEKLVQSLLRLEYKRIMEEVNVEEPQAIAYNGGKILMQMMGECWENSLGREYINSLLNHFQENTAFDLLSIEDDVLIAFAAFCQKGDNIDRLKDYLVQKGIGNYRLAFGLYGATRGFALLPKTFTSLLINGNKEYYEEVWCTVYECLFGLKINKALFPEPAYQSSVGTKYHSNIDMRRQKQVGRVSAIEETALLENAALSPKEFMHIVGSNLGTRSNVYKALKETGFEHMQNFSSKEELKAKVMSIIEPKLPKKKRRQETIEKIEGIITGLATKKQDSETAPNNVSKKWGACPKEINSALPQMVSVENEYGLPNLKCLKGLPDNVIRRLGHIWHFTGREHNIKEHISLFINLCSKEGRGEIPKQISLRGVFVGNLAEAVETELKEYYKI